MPSPDEFASLLAGRRRYPIDDPVAGYSAPNDPAEPGVAPYMAAAPQFRSAPRTGQSIQDILDDIKRKQQEFHAPAPTVPEQIGDIVSKTGQVAKSVATAPINAVANLYGRVAEDYNGSPSLSSDDYRDPNAMAKDQEVPATALGLMGAGVPFAKPGALGAAGGKLVVPAAERAAGTIGPFYSAVEQAVGNTKLAKAPMDQWYNFLKGQPGVKAEELAQLGIAPGNTVSLTREQMLGHVNANQVHLNEVHKVSGEKKSKDQLILENMNRGYTRAEAEETANRQLNEGYMNNMYPIEQTKYSQYQLPGGSNYQETLLTLPNKEKLPDTSNWKAIPNTNGPFKIVNDKNQLLGYSNGENSEEAIAKLANNYRIPEKGYTSSHWDEPNPLVHVRHNDRMVAAPGGAGELPSLHLEEVQSDWHQEGRKRGYSDSSIQELPSGYQVVRTDKNGLYQNNNSPNATHYAVYNPGGYPVTSRLSFDSENEAKQAALQALRFGGQEVEGSVPNAPFKASWPDLALKRMLYKAATDVNPDGTPKYHALSWTPGDAQNARYPREDAEANVGMKKFYDEMLVSKANALGKKYGAKVGRSPDQGLHMLPITPELRAAAAKGFPLFATGAVAGPAISQGLDDRAAKALATKPPDL